jgi:hypothetical protein
MGCEVYQSPPSGAEVKNEWSLISLPPHFPYVSWCVLVTTLPLGTHVAQLMIMRNTHTLTGKLYEERKL